MEIHNLFISRPTIINVGKQVPTVVLQRPVEFQIKISKDCHDVNFQASYEISRYNVCCRQCHNELFKFGKSRIFKSRHKIITNNRQLPVSVNKSQSSFKQNKQKIAKLCHLNICSNRKGANYHVTMLHMEATLH